jgi:hypothetical protein
MNLGNKEIGSLSNNINYNKLIIILFILGSQLKRGRENIIEKPYFHRKSFKVKVNFTLIYLRPEEKARIKLMNC